MHRWRNLCCVALSLLSTAALAQSLSAKPAPKPPPAARVNLPPDPYPATHQHPGPAWFEDVAPQAGLHMLNVNGGVDHKQYIIETTGSGVAILDYDRDGYPDIYFPNGETLRTKSAPPPTDHPTGHLYHNNHDGTFADVTQAAGLTSNGWGQGACVGDYDNDGYDDLYVTYYGKNRLYHNQGDGTFKEVAEQANVAGNGTDWSTGCSFVDYDRDGKLDIMVATYVKFDLATAPVPGQGLTCIWKGTPVECGPRGLPYTSQILYRNLGNGKFADVSRTAGIDKTDAHYCFSVSTLDFNQDGWPDIYIACDSTASILFRNNKNGTFTDVAADAGVAYSADGREQAGMGSTVGDYNGDGLQDIFKTNFSDDTSSLYLNNGDGTFTPSIEDVGLSLNTQYLGWGTMFIDVDNDSWPDLLIVNGHVYPEVDTGHLGSTYKEPRLFYRNQGNGKFKDLSLQCGAACMDPKSSRGMAIADFWNDGRESAVINNMSELPMLLVNVAANNNHWLGVITVGTKSNRDGIGAQVTVFAGAHHWMHEVRSGSSYISSSDLRLHFGLGKQSTIDHVDVRWPSGLHEVFPLQQNDHAPATADRFVTLVEGKGKPE